MIIDGSLKKHENEMRRLLDIVIPAAGLGRRLKEFGSKSLTQLGNGETLIGRQVRVLHEVFPCAKIVVVTGYEMTRMKRAMPFYVTTVFNRDYQEANVNHSLNLGLQQTNADSVLIVYGDLIFNTKSIKTLDLTESCIVTDTSQFRQEEAGVTVVDGYVTQFSYGLETTWAQIVLLTGDELELFKRLSAEPRRKRYFGFEILNLVLEAGGNFKAITQPEMHLLELDTPADLENLVNYENPLQLYA